jgi:prolyl-tRNA editing enzyme YbaK/EbsC (Cys-tRNA(Pro) deacylase)
MSAKGSAFGRYRVELAFALIGVALAAASPFFGGSVEIAWLAGVLAAILPAFVALVKHDFSSFMEIFIKDALTTQRQTSEITEILSDLSGERLSFARQELSKCVTKLNKINSGRIPLDETTYFQMIIDCMEQSPPNSEVLAVNSIDERRWKEDPRQINYFRANKVALSKGVRITRAFVVDKNNITGQFGDERLNILLEQIQDKRIDVYVIWREDLEKSNVQFEDWVFFKNPDKKLFLAHADAVDQIRVDNAEMIVDAQEISKYEAKFNLLKSFSISNEIIETEYLRNRTEFGHSTGSPRRQLTNQAKTIASSRAVAFSEPPGNTLKPLFLSKDVVTCQEAAEAKNIPLKHELKTLILKTSRGLVALNLRGDQDASLRRVKEVLRCQEAYLAETGDLVRLNLSQGTVCPILEPTWSLPQLIDFDLLALEYVSTNNGTYRGYFKFDPKLLLNASSVTRGHFKEPNS